MATKLFRGVSDPTIEQIAGALEIYSGNHPAAQIDLYRQNPVSVRVRIIDPDFSGQERIQRHDAVWRILANLPEEAQLDVTMLVLLTPDELSESFANSEFEDPVRSVI